MSRKTALQIAMGITQRYANSLFDEHTARGRQFMQEMSECLEQEREQIVEAWENGYSSNQGISTYGYSDRYQNTSEKYYINTYKGGEQ